MPVSIGGPGFLFRFLVAGMTAILIVLVMSTAMTFVAGAATGAGGDLTGGFLNPSPRGAVLIASQIAVGIVAFLGSFFVMSKK